MCFGARLRHFSITTTKGLKVNVDIVFCTARLLSVPVWIVFLRGSENLIQCGKDKPLNQTIMNTKKRGFTLIEILLVVAAIVILAGIVIVAINPGKQLADTRNAEREANVNAIVDAIQQYAIDNSGTLPTELGTSGDCDAAENEICQTDGTCTDLVDLSVLTNNEEYLTTIPTDPQEDGADATGYHAVASANNRVTVCAPSAEQGETIEVTK